MTLHNGENKDLQENKKWKESEKTISFVKSITMGYIMLNAHPRKHTDKEHCTDRADCT